MVFTELEFDNIFKIFSFCTSRTHVRRRSAHRTRSAPVYCLQVICTRSAQVNSAFYSSWV